MFGSMAKLRPEPITWTFSVAEMPESGSSRFILYPIAF